MVFVDTWAWIALAFRRDQHHEAAKAQHTEFLAAGEQYVTTDYVLSETTTQLYRLLPAVKAQSFLNAIRRACESGRYQLIHVSRSQFFEAWSLREKYADKPTISFVDFTSFVVMSSLSIIDVFSGDVHFEQVNLGFRRMPVLGSYEP